MWYTCMHVFIGIIMRTIVIVIVDAVGLYYTVCPFFCDHQSIRFTGYNRSLFVRLCIHPFWPPMTHGWLGHSQCGMSVVAIEMFVKDLPAYAAFQRRELQEGDVILRVGAVPVVDAPLSAITNEFKRFKENVVFEVGRFVKTGDDTQDADHAADKKQ